MDFIIEKGRKFHKLACLSNQKLVRMDFLSIEESVLEGNIYRGKVKKINKNMNSAIVDIGISDGYLQDNYSLDNIKKGDEILIQVKRPGYKDKLPKLTRELSLMGRYSVLIPNSKNINFSNKINDNVWTTKLKDYLEMKINEPYGIVIRTLAYSASFKDIEEDINNLILIWNEIQKKSKLGINPKEIYIQYDPIERFIFQSNPYKIDKLICNDLEILKRVEKSIKAKVDILSTKFIDTLFLIDYLNLTSEMRSMFQKKVKIDDNISLFVESTEACHIIDVNGGNANFKLGFEKNAFHINFIAATEAVRQIVLRDLSGIILIDFIDMKDAKNKAKLIEHVNCLLKNDGKKASVTSITELGIMQIIRKRDNQNIYEKYTKPCPLCDGSGSVLSDSLYFEQLFIELQNELKHTNKTVFKVKLPYSQNDFTQKYISEIENQLNIQLDIDFIELNDMTINAHF